MRIAQVSPLYESVPPQGYGGTERVVSYLTEELVRRGHDVTLYASGDSVTSARMVSVCEKSLRTDLKCVDPLAHHFVMLEKLFSDISRFDIIHFHIDYLHFPLTRRYGEPNITTLHGRLDLPDLACLYREYSDMPLVSISNAQRNPVPFAGWQGTVYHGLPRNLFRFHEKHSGYLAFLGRMSPEKRPDRAIEIATRAGIPLRIAAKVDRTEVDYFESRLKPLLNNPLVEFLGEIGGAEKEEFLGNALALLFPIDWPEPFGLVMIESMACGTPVIAYRAGSVPEILEDGITGFVVDDIESAVKAVRKVERLDRRKCRQMFDSRFTVERMASDYLEIYRKILGKSEKPGRVKSARAAAAA